MKVISDTKVISASKNSCIIHAETEVGRAAVNLFFDDITRTGINSVLIIVFLL